MRWPWLKRAIHSKGFFLATLIVLMMSVSLFAGTNYSGEVSAKFQIEKTIAQLPYQFDVGTGNLLSSQGYMNMSNSVRSVDGVKAAELRSTGFFRGNVSGGNGKFELWGVPRTSVVFSGVRVLSGGLSRTSGEVDVWSSSTNASRLKLGDSIEANFAIFVSSAKQVNITRTLIVGGFVDIDQRSLAELTGVTSGLSLIPANNYVGTVLLTDWNSTFSSLIDSAVSQGVTIDPFYTGVYAYVNAADFSSLDLQASTTTAEQLQERLQVQASKYNAGVFGQGFLQTLQSGTTVIDSARLTFVFVALPVLMIAWYLISVLFSILWKYRRGDLALYLTKGFSRSQIMRMSFLEGILLGGFGTVFGIVLGLLFSFPLIETAGFDWTQIVFGESFVYSVLFGLGTAILFTVYPSWKIVQDPIIQSLTEMDRTKPFDVARHGFVQWLVFLIGIGGTTASFLSVFPKFNLQATLATGLFVQAWNLLAIPLVVLAPFLLLWGSARLLAGSGLVEHISAILTRPVIGDLNWISTKSLRKDVSWLFKFTVLLSLIVSYLVLSPAFISSQGDYYNRNAKSVVGADIQATVATLPNETLTHSRALSIGQTLGNWQGVSSVTVEYTTSLALRYNGGSTPVPVMIIDPVSWLNTAYYENEWFSTNPGNLFNNMHLDNQTIILSKDFVLGVTNYLGTTPLNSVLPFQATYPNQTIVSNLRVIGLFGPASQTPHVASATPSWSFVPAGLFGNSNPSITTATVLLKAPSADISALEEKISSAFPGVDVVSASALLQTLSPDATVSVTGSILSIGLFPTVAASLVGLVALVFESLWLEKRENELLILKGVTRSKVRSINFSKYLPIIALFSALGSLVGYALLVGLVTVFDVGESGLVTMKPFVGPLVPVVLTSFLVTLSFGIYAAIRIETQTRARVS